MSLIKYIERMRHIDSLLRRKAACSTAMLAKKIRLSRSTTIEYMNDMKKLGFPIHYSRKQKCFYYEVDGKMTSQLFEKVSKK